MNDARVKTLRREIEDAASDHDREKRKSGSPSWWGVAVTSSILGQVVSTQRCCPGDARR